MKGESNGTGIQEFPGSLYGNSRKQTGIAAILKSALPLTTQDGSGKSAMCHGRGNQRGCVPLRIGSVNVHSLRGKDGEVVIMAVEGCLDFCCLQETRWRGEGARRLRAYKLFWMGCKNGIHGVGMLVANRWIEKVLEVKRVSERLMVVRVIVGRSVLNLISLHAPQMGRSMVGRRFSDHAGKSSVGDRFW